MMLANRLLIPDGIQAILWDMDGVLLDTLTFDYQLCNQLLRTCAGWDVQLTRSTIRHNFPYLICPFWRRLVDSTGIGHRRPAAGSVAEGRSSPAHEQARRDAAFAAQHRGDPRCSWQPPGAQGLRQAVVSNNPTAEVREMVHRAGHPAAFQTT